MILIFIQQQSSHYVVMVLMLVFSNVYIWLWMEMGWYMLSWYVWWKCIVYMYLCQWGPNWILFWWFFKGSSQPPLVPLFYHLTGHQWLIVSVCLHIVLLGPILWHPGKKSMNEVCLLLRLSELFSLFVELRHCYLECD